MDSDMIVSLRDQYRDKQEVSRAPQFQGGIDAIFALGCCLNVISDPNAALLPLSEGKFKLGVSGNEQDRLPVVIHDCANVGLTTFVQTQGHMELLKTKANTLMSPIGPIIKIIRCLEKKPSAFNTKRLEAQQEIVKNTINSMRAILDKIAKEWKNWKAVVDDLSRRGQNTEINVADAQEETKKQIGATQLKLAEYQKQLEEFRSQLDELRVQQRQTELQYQQSLDKHPNGRDGMIKTWLKLRSIRREINETQARYDAAQCRCLNQKQAIINIQLKELRLQASKSNLESDLEQLVRIRSVLALTCKQLRNVISSIEIFVMFFNNIEEIVDGLHGGLKQLQESNPELHPDIDEDEIQELRRDTMESATTLRCDLWLIASTARTYGVISASAYIPGMKYVYGLGTTCLGDLDEQQRKVEGKLEDLKRQGHDTVNTICGEREAKFTEELEPMIKQICASTTKQSITWTRQTPEVT